MRPPPHGVPDGCHGEPVRGGQRGLPRSRHSKRYVRYVVDGGGRALEVRDGPDTAPNPRHRDEVRRHEGRSPAAPPSAERTRPAPAGREERIENVPEADLGAQRKRHHTARLVYDGLVTKHSYTDTYSNVQRFVCKLRRARAAGPTRSCASRMRYGRSPDTSRD